MTPDPTTPPTHSPSEPPPLSREWLVKHRVKLLIGVAALAQFWLAIFCCGGFSYWWFGSPRRVQQTQERKPRPLDDANRDLASLIPSSKVQGIHLDELRSVDATRFANEFIADERAAHEKYAGQRIRVTGSVVIADFDALGDFITISAGPRCNLGVALAPGYNAMIKKMRAGDPITISAVYHSCSINVRSVIRMREGIIVDEH